MVMPQRESLPQKEAHLNVPVNSKNMKIRFAEEKDMESLIELCKAHALYEKSNFDENSKKEQLSKHLFEPQSGLKCLVVESGIEIIGYATFFKQFSMGCRLLHLSRLSVPEGKCKRKEDRPANHGTSERAFKRGRMLNHSMANARL